MLNPKSEVFIWAVNIISTGGKIFAKIKYLMWALCL